jgi:G patch domain/KOW motif-containing protein
LSFQSTLEDYESIPIVDYGVAMLRGMGWNPGKGIGKKER